MWRVFLNENDPNVFEEDFSYYPDINFLIDMYSDEGFIPMELSGEVRKLEVEILKKLPALSKKMIYMKKTDNDNEIFLFMYDDDSTDPIEEKRGDE